MTKQRTDTGRLCAIAGIVALGTVVPTASGASQQESPPGTETTVALSGPAGNVINMILVKVNGDPILLSDLQDLEEDQLAILRQQIPEDEIQAQLPLLRENLLRGLIDTKMMLQRADRLGITADANLVDRQIQSVRETNSLTSDEDFEAALAEVGMTVEDMREQVRRTIRRQTLVFEEVNRNVFVSEREIRAYYQEHTDEFGAPEQVRLQQLVFLTQGGDPEALQQQAEAALQELREGAAFDTVASKYTNALPFADESFIAVSDLNETLAAAVPELAENSYSDVLRSDFGFQLVRVLERQEQAVSPLEDVRDVIRSRLTTEKSQKRMTEYLAGLRERTTLEIFDPRFAGIEETWKAAEDSRRVEAR